MSQSSGHASETSGKRPSARGSEVGYVTVTGYRRNSAQQQVNFKEALLELKVTPTITQDGRVFLSMAVKKDEIHRIRQSWVRIGVLTTELAKREVTARSTGRQAARPSSLGGVYEFTAAEGH
ncbi:MAG: hypothetical protein V9G12_24220 [Microthrixaceae bacterium]